MKLIIGLGNPGKEYERTRHNIGFAAIFNFKFLILNSDFSDWKFEKKFKAEIAKGELNEEKIILAMPQTFMNNSGETTKLLVTRYALPVTNLFIIHDDLDLPLGKIKISFNASSAGHNGVQSIIDALKTKEFWRLRIGISPHPNPLTQGEREPAEKFVLKPFGKSEQTLLKKTLDKAVEALLIALKDPKKAMSQFN